MHLYFELKRADAHERVKYAKLCKNMQNNILYLTKSRGLESKILLFNVIIVFPHIKLDRHIE